MQEKKQYNISVQSKGLLDTILDMVDIKLNGVAEEQAQLTPLAKKQAFTPKNKKAKNKKAKNKKAFRIIESISNYIDSEIDDRLQSIEKTQVHQVDKISSTKLEELPKQKTNSSFPTAKRDPNYNIETALNQQLKLVEETQSRQENKIKDLCPYCGRSNCVTNQMLHSKRGHR